MPSETKKFQQDLLESVKQMRAGKAARMTKVKLPAAAEVQTSVTTTHVSPCRYD